MSEVKRRRLCSRRTKAGERCRAWAMLGSEPAVCVVHAKVAVSPGAPKGNRYALKHGIYQKLDPPEAVAEIDEATVADELRLLRKGLIKMNELIERDDLEPEQYAVVMGRIVSGVKAVFKLEPAVVAMRRRGVLEAALEEIANNQ